MFMRKATRSCHRPNKLFAAAMGEGGGAGAEGCDWDGVLFAAGWDWLGGGSSDVEAVS
jgi:hypothetical protein